MARTDKDKTTDKPTPTPPTAATAATAATAITTAGTTTGAAIDELADLEGEYDDDDGLGGIDRDEIRIPSRLLNCRRLDASKRPIPDDVYYDTVTQETTREIRAAFVYRHKAKRYDYFDTEANRTRVVCRSHDRVTGTMVDEQGVVTHRPCQGCPDDQWYSDDKGKRRKNCSPVHNMFAVDLATRQPFVVRFKRTALPTLKEYLQRYHLNRRPMPGGGVGNYPVYAFEVTLGACMSDDGKFAFPTLTKGARLPPELVRELHASSKGCEDYVKSGSVMDRIDDADTGASAGGDADAGDASFGYGANAGGAREPGDRYVDNDRSRD